MNVQARPAEKLADLPAETGEFLSKLSPDDLDALGRFIPLIKRLLAFGVFARWIILTVVAVVIGASALWDSVANIVKHLRTPW